MAESEVNNPAVVIQESVDVDMADPAADAEVEITGSNAVKNGDALSFASFTSTTSPAQSCSSTSRRTCAIDLTEPVDAVGCFLAFLYTGEYFPQKIANTHRLVNDATAPDLDATATISSSTLASTFLADKFGITKLKELAHSKVHSVKSSAKDVIAYARYVYATTPKEDDTIRKPVASFWAQRSHVLRAEAEDEFRQMCLEFPQFSFDVSTRLLDEEAKNERMEKPSSGTPTGITRKRAGQSTMA